MAADNDEHHDFELEVVVYNAHILRRIAKMGMVHEGRPSVTQLINKMGYGSGCSNATRWAREAEIRGIIGLKIRPTDVATGQWKPIVLEMVQALGCAAPEDLFPGQLRDYLPSKTFMILSGNVGKPTELRIM